VIVVGVPSGSVAGAVVLVAMLGPEV
jgi:hypothetical protein